MTNNNKHATLCNNCAGTVVLSLNDHHTDKAGLVFCCVECAETYASQGDDDPEHWPVGLWYDLGGEG